MTPRQAMERLDANVLTEDGLMLRTCEHGIRHPVGRVTGKFRESEIANVLDALGNAAARTQRHEQRAPQGIGPIGAECCGCCSGYARQEFSL